jgi:hypothetical protein
MLEHTIPNWRPTLVAKHGAKNSQMLMDKVKGHFQATGTPMAKILRLDLSAQCVLREITILHNFAIEKVEKNISLQRFRDLKTLFQNCFKRTVKKNWTLKVN